MKTWAVFVSILEFIWEENYFYNFPCGQFGQVSLALFLRRYSVQGYVLVDCDISGDFIFCIVRINILRGNEEGKDQYLNFFTYYFQQAYFKSWSLYLGHKT